MDPTSLVIGVTCGCAVGFAMAWFLARQRSAEHRVRLEERSQQLEQRDQELHATRGRLSDLADQMAQLDRERARLEQELRSERAASEEKLQLLAEAEAKFRETFKALSADALSSNNKTFLDLAQKTFDSVVKESQGHLAKGNEQLSGLLKPLSESLQRYEKQTQSLEEKRQRAYGSLEEQLKRVTLTQERLEQETGRLVSALRRPGVSGRWGEMALRNIVEIAGMTEYCDFEVQVHVETQETVFRPDMLVRLPSGRRIVVDAKAPVEHYLAAIEASNEAERNEATAHHVRSVRTHIDRLSSKQYHRLFEEAPEFVVMFVPESSFVAALEGDRKLLEYSMSRRIVVATPTTLIALLWSVAYGWRHQELAKSAQEISALGQTLYERLSVWTRHFDGIKRGLERAVGSYNDAVGSLERRVLPSARRFRELGIGRDEESPTTEIVDRTLRTLETEHDDTLFEEEHDPS